MNNDDNQFLNQYMNDGNNKEENEIMRATSLLSKASHIFYTENINNGFDKDQAMELTLEYVSSALTNGGN